MQASSSYLATLLATILPITLLIVVNVGIGIACNFMAKNRGFNQVAAFFAGLFGGIVTLFIIAMFPKKTEQ